MKSKILVIAVLLFSTNIFAKKVTVAENKPTITNKKRNPADNAGKIIVTPAEEGMDTNDFNNEDYSVEGQNRNYNNESMNKKVRDKILTKSGIANYAGQWDHLEKDIFVLRAKNYNFEQFRSLYPQIPEQNLQSAYTYIRNSK